MRLDKFDLNLLVVLDTLLEERNVTRASARLHIGQSAASGALARLREYFGDELLVPVGRRMVLTALAESLVVPVRDTLLQARATLARKPGFDPATAQRNFLICASDYATTVLLVMPEPYMAPFPEPKTSLFEDTHVCMVWSENGLVGETFTFEQYMALGHVAVHFGDEHSLSFEEWFLPRSGQQRRIELVVDNFSILPQVLIGTNRVATLHRRQAEHFTRHLPVRLVDTPFDMPPLIEVVAWPSHLEHDPAHIWLRNIVNECVADLRTSDSESKKRNR